MREYPIPEVEPEGILAKVTMPPICGSGIHVFKGEHVAHRVSKENPRLLGRSPDFGRCKNKSEIQREEVKKKLPCINGTM